MNQMLQVEMLLAIAAYFIILIHLLRKKSLNLKYTLLWLFAGLIMLVLALFPGILDVFSGLLGIYDPTNALFAVILFCLLMILVSLTAIVSKMHEQIKRLAQSQAILEKRLRDIEKEYNILH